MAQKRRQNKQVQKVVAVPTSTFIGATRFAPAYYASLDTEDVVVSFSETFSEIQNLVVSPIINTNTNSYLVKDGNAGFTIKFAGKLKGNAKILYRAQGEIIEVVPGEEVPAVSIDRSVSFDSVYVSFHRGTNAIDPIPTVSNFSRSNYGVGGSTYSWEIIDSPGGAISSFSDSSSESPTFITDLLGSYTIRLTVTDSVDEQSDSADTTFTVVNRAPTIELGDTLLKSNSLLGSNINISSGDYSVSDPDSDPLSISWTLLSSPVGSTPNFVSTGGSAGARITPDLPGTYSIQAVVDDGTGTANSTATDVVNIVINSPVVIATEDEIIPYHNVSTATSDLVLYASCVINDTDSYGNVQLPVWELHDRATVGTATIEVGQIGDGRGKISIYGQLNQGDAFSLLVNVDENYSSGALLDTTSAVKSYVVNSLPTASAIPSEEYVKLGSTFILDGSSSYAAPNNSLTSSAWTYTGSADNGTLKTVSPGISSYEAQGTPGDIFTFKLTVVDNFGDSDSYIKNMIINAPPIASISGDSIAYRAIDHTFDGSASDVGSSSEVVSQSLTYLWEIFKSDYTTARATITTNTSSTTDIQLGQFGDFIVRLTVDDGIDENVQEFPITCSAYLPNIASFTETLVWDGSTLVRGDSITINPVISSSGIINTGDVLDYSWEAQNSRDGTTWRTWHERKGGIGIEPTFTFIVPSLSAINYVRIKLLITDSLGTTDSFISTVWAV